MKGIAALSRHWRPNMYPLMPIVLPALVFFTGKNCFRKRAGLEHSSPYSLTQMTRMQVRP